MQIEGEYADDSGGANLKDNQNGSSGGLDVGDTGTAWMEYKSVKLSNLDELIVRYAGKSAASINVSLEKSAASGLIASKTVGASGGWSTWAEAKLDLDNEAIDAAQRAGKLDEYGCATIYIQTNGVNLDYFRLNYIKNNDDEPYLIQKLLNKTNGRVKATLKYRGSTLAEDVLMVSSVEGKADTTKTITVRGSGEYEIKTGAEPNDVVNIYVCKTLDDTKLLSQKAQITYQEPVDSKIVVYALTRMQLAVIIPH